MDDVNTENPAMDASDAAISELSASAAATQQRRGAGRPFAPGTSGNPKGRPRGSREIGELARSHAPAAIGRLRELMASRDEAIAIAACRAILDRGFGKPTQSINATGGPLVSVTFHKGHEPLALDDAQAIYAQIANRPDVDIRSIRFAPAEVPAILEHLDDGKGGE